MGRTWIACCCLLVSGLGFAGCASTKKQTPVENTALRLDLRELVRHFSTRIERAADEVIAATDDPAYERNAIYWKIRIIPNARGVLEQADVQAAYLNLWVLTKGMRYFFAEGKGKDYFGEHTAMAVEASDEVASAVRAAGPRFLTEEKLAAMDKRIDQFAAELATRYSEQGDARDTKNWDTEVSTILEKPLDLIRVPLSWVNPSTGLSDTAAAVHRASETVDGLRLDVDYLPSSVRWYVQLLLIELSQNDVVRQAVDSFSEVSASSTKLADTAQRLPEDVTRVIEQVGAEQAALQTTLRELQTTLAGIDTTLGQVDRAAQSLTATGAAWTGLVTEVDRFIDGFRTPPGAEPKEPEPAGEKGRPFDINEYTRASDSLAESARVLSTLIGRVEELTGPEQRTALARTAGSTVGSIVDRALIGAALFVLFAAVVALGYRLAVVKLSRGSN